MHLGIWRVAEDDPDSGLYDENSDVKEVIDFMAAHSSERELPDKSPDTKGCKQGEAFCVLDAGSAVSIMMRRSLPTVARTSQSRTKYLPTAGVTSSGAASGNVCQLPQCCPRSAPGHFDLSFEIDVSGTLEGVRHGGVAEVCGGADPQDFVPGEDAGALGEDVVDLAVATVLGQHGKIGHGRVVVVAGRITNPAGLPAGRVAICQQSFGVV
jgi:hypothetical protein